MLGKVVAVFGLAVSLNTITNESLVKYLAWRVPQLRFGSWDRNYNLQLTNKFGGLNEMLKSGLGVSLLAPNPSDDTTLFSVDTRTFDTVQFFGGSVYYATEGVPVGTRAVIDISLRRAAYSQSKVSYFAKNIGLNVDNNLQTLKIYEFSYTTAFTTALFIKNQRELNDRVEKLVLALKQGSLYDCARALIETNMGSAPVCQQCPEQLSCLGMASTHVRGYDK